MKFRFAFIFPLLKDAPHAGARIEISSFDLKYFTAETPPTRGRELKYAAVDVTPMPGDAPHAGARIEIFFS